MPHRHKANTFLCQAHPDLERTLNMSRLDISLHQPFLALHKHASHNWSRHCTGLSYHSRVWPHSSWRDEQHV